MAGIIAVNFREDDDELIGAGLCTAEDDVLLVSRKGQAIRFAADDNQLRPMGRATSGVTGMKFRDGDALLSMSIIGADMAEDDRFVFTVTDGGFAKRTRVSEYRQQGRGGFGIKAMKLNEDRGSLVGGLVVAENDQVIAIKASGQITRSAVNEVAVKGRDTMGVRFVGVRDDDSVVVIALNPEATAAAVELDADASTEDVTALDEATVTVLVEDEGDEAGDDDPREDDSAVDDSVSYGTEAEEDDSE
jgi:DNA gyrase subunit A